MDPSKTADDSTEKKIRELEQMRGEKISEFDGFAGGYCAHDLQRVHEQTSYSFAPFQARLRLQVSSR